MTPEHLCFQPHHKNGELKFYSETCQCNISKVHRDEMRGALVCAQEVTSKLTNAIDANAKMAEQVETSRENATLLINQSFEQLHQTIDIRKKALLSGWRPFYFPSQHF